MEAFALMREELRRERAIKAELLAALKGWVKLCEIIDAGYPTEVDAAIAKAEGRA